MLLLVNGIGGIGKTTLAARYYHKYAAEYAHLIWAAVNTDIAAAFAEIASALNLQFPATSTVAEHTAQTVLALTELKQPCLLVLDNANNPQDLAANYHDALRKLSCLHVLVTTRVPDLSCAETLRIGHLEPNAALELFKAFYPQHRAEDDALLADILAAVDFHTLTIEIMAKSIAERNRLRQHCSLAALRQMLLDKGVLQLHLSAAVQTDYQHLQKAQPEAIIASMYDLAELGDAEKKLLSLFSVLPAKNIPLAHLEDLLPKFTELETVADGLARKGWVEFEQRSGQFKISPVVQEIVRKENAARLANDAKELVDYLGDKLAYQAGTGILTEINNHHLALDYVQYGESLCQYLLATSDEDISFLLGFLLERLGQFFITFGNLPKALAFFEKDAKLTQELHEAHPEHIGFKNGLAISYSKLGETHSSLGHLQDALAFFEKRSKLGQELHEAHPEHIGFRNGLAVSYANLGVFAKERQDDVETAQNYLITAQNILQELVVQAPDYAKFQQNLQKVNKILAELKSATAVQ